MHYLLFASGSFAAKKKGRRLLVIFLGVLVRCGLCGEEENANSVLQF
jgi:hypothetical protein